MNTREAFRRYEKDNDHDAAIMLAEAFYNLATHLASGFMTCDSDPRDQRFEVRIRFERLEDAQKMHRHLLGVE